MLEPLLAASLAGNIVTFIDFSSKIVRGTKELGSRVLPADLATTRRVCNDLISSLQRAHNSPRPTAYPDVRTAIDSELQEWIEDSLEELTYFLAKLDRLGLQDSPNVWKRFRRAVKIAYKKSALQELHATLDRYQAAYTRHLVERSSLLLTDVHDGVSLVRDEQRDIGSSQQSLQSHLVSTSSRLHQLLPTVTSGFADAAQKQDEISNSLVHLRDTHRDLADGQSQIIREPATSVRRDQDLLAAIFSSQGIIGQMHSTSMAHNRFQIDSLTNIRRITDANTTTLERLYQAAYAKTYAEDKTKAPEAFLHLNLRLPPSQIMMDFVIRPIHDGLSDNALSDVSTHLEPPSLIMMMIIIYGIIVLFPSAFITPYWHLFH